MFDSKSKKASKKVARTIVEHAAQSFPIVKTVQAIQTALEVGSNVSQLVARASDVAERTQKFVPEMQVMAQSFCDNVKIIGYFSSTATAIGIGVNMVQTYQGIQALQLIAAKLDGISNQLAAQTALTAQKEFPQYVYDMIGERLNQTLDDPVCDHWFFLYHPDNDWYPKFYHLLEKKPFGQRFCGYTNQIDTIFIFMLAARRQIEKRNLRAREKGRPFRHVKLHLLMPAYQPVLIAEALKVPDEIGDFIMEGRINSNKAFVWLNLPEDQRSYVMDIGHWAPPSPGWLGWAMSKVGMAEKPLALGEPRVLGTRQRLDNEQNNSECEGSDGDAADDAGDEITNQSNSARESDAESNQHAATPLQHRRRGHRKKSRRREKESRGGKDRSHGEPSSANSHREHADKKASRNDEDNELGSANSPAELADKKASGLDEDNISSAASNPWVD